MRRVLFVVALVVASFGFAQAAQAKSCADFDSQAEAQRYLRAHPQDPDHLDPDNNGIACENAPSPQDYVPVRHVDSSGSTIPLEQDSPTTRPPGGTTSTSVEGDTTTTFDDTSSGVTDTTADDTTDGTISVNQRSEDGGVSTTGIAAVIVGMVLFGALYVWIRRR